MKPHTLPDPSTEPSRKHRRRKEARPAEIIEAAMAVFLEYGFGAAKMEEVARRAQVSKGTVFRYFPTKPDLFRAVAHTALTTNLGPVRDALSRQDMPLRTLLPALLGQAGHLAQSGLPAIARLLLSEARTFPDLPKIWYDEVVSQVLDLLTGAIERAQARGEIRSGDARLYAFSIIGPMMSALLFREVFATATTALPDLPQLADHHADILMRGLFCP